MSSPVFIVVRADLPPGLQLAQVAHVAAALALRVVASVDAAVEVLHAKDKNDIIDLAYNAEDAIADDAAGRIAARSASSAMSDRGLFVAFFKEPDLRGELTAVALFGARAAALVHRYPRAFDTGR